MAVKGARGRTEVLTLSKSVTRDTRTLSGKAVTEKATTYIVYMSDGSVLRRISHKRDNDPTDPGKWNVILKPDKAAVGKVLEHHAQQITMYRERGYK